MTVQDPTLFVYEAGELTVVGFGGREILDCVDLTDCRQQVADLIAEHHCKVLAFDLTGVKLMPSGLLGLLTSIREMGVEVHLYNPCEDVREVLAVTKLDRLLQTHDIAV